MATAKQLAHRARAKKCFKIKGANRMSKVSACLRKKWLTLSTISELQAQILTLQTNLQNSLDDIERKKKALPLFYGSPDFDDLNALGMQANRIRQSVTLKIGQIQSEINKMQLQSNIQAGNTEIIQASRDGTATNISSISPLLLVAGAVALILALR